MTGSKGTARKPCPAQIDDPRQLVSFTFEGRQLAGRQGQSIASALLANGVDILGRSFKFHRPRGYLCGAGACPNCEVSIDGLPGRTSCLVPLCGGEDVRRERGWPSAGVDVLRVADLASRFLGAGFQFRLFAHQPRLAQLFERGIARMAGGRKMPRVPAASALIPATVRRLAVDVVVVGAGISGMQAALAAAEAGAGVCLVERESALGGWARHSPSPTDVEQVQQLTAAVARSSIVRLHGTAVGWYEEGLLPVVMASELVEVEPIAVIVACGGYDLPLLFQGNDRPGVRLASAALRLAFVDRVRPGRRAVVLTDRVDGYELAAALSRAGVHIVAIGDRRQQIPPADILLLKQEGSDIEVFSGAEPVRTHGHRRVRGISIQVGEVRKEFKCDLVCVAVGTRGADELVLQLGYAAAGSQERAPVHQVDASARVAPNAWVVGTAAGGPDDAALARQIGGEAAAAARSHRVE